MLDPMGLAFNASSIVISTAVPGMAWALLFGLAWAHPGFAESIGLGRRTFWLLLPGAVLASFALLPVAPVANDVLAVSLGGAAFPLGVAVAALDRIASPLRAWWGRLFAPLVVTAGVLLGVVLLADAGALDRLARGLGTTPGGAESILVGILALALVGAIVAWWCRGDDPADRAAAGIFGLTVGVMLLTFLGSTPIPGVGIAESYPFFLVPPLVAGALTALLARRIFPGREGFALPAAFFAGGWGVVLGADVLRQPPLYGSGPGGLYAVGGAGVLDLVYLSGFLALLAAWATHRLLGRGFVPLGAPIPPEPPSPYRALREAFTLLGDGDLTGSVRAAAEAARSAGVQAQRLVGRPLVGPSGPWSGLVVPGWVVSDQANLDCIAHGGTDDRREAVRAFVTARALVRLGAALERGRFASIAQRLAAFAVDLLVLGTAGAAVFAAIVAVTTGGLNGALSSTALNAAIYGFVAVALLYFALMEYAVGATVGKRILGIEVRSRTLGRPAGLAAFVRNASLLPVVTLLGIGLAVSIAIAMRGIPSVATLAGLGISAGTLAILTLTLVVVIGVGLAGTVGVAVMAVTAERQRVGDLWAGTWVVRRIRSPDLPPSAAPMVAPYA